MISNNISDLHNNINIFPVNFERDFLEGKKILLEIQRCIQNPVKHVRWGPEYRFSLARIFMYKERIFGSVLKQKYTGERNRSLLFQ